METQTGVERQPANVPTVLMFKPTEFEVVPQERMGEWETTLRKQVGLATSPDLMRSGTPCYSWCGDVIFDDCDEL